jgi:hypothetical protein
MDPGNNEKGSNFNSINQSRIDLLVKMIQDSDLKDELGEDFSIMNEYVSLGIHDSEGVWRDMRYVVDRANLFFRQREKNNEDGLIGNGEGEVLEYLIDSFAEQYDWFGESTFISRTLRYDDWANGVDFVLEYDSGDESLGKIDLVIDCTCGKKEINRKIKNNREMLAAYGGRMVKYHDSGIPGLDYKGPKLCIPLVIGIDNERINEFRGHLNDKKFIAESPVQIAFLQEMKAQLEMYLRYLSSGEDITYRNSVEIITELNRVLDWTSRVLEAKSDLVNQPRTENYIHNDVTFGLIDFYSSK